MPQVGGAKVGRNNVQLALKKGIQINCKVAAARVQQQHTFLFNVHSTAYMMLTDMRNLLAHVFNSFHSVVSKLSVHI